VDKLDTEIRRLASEIRSVEKMLVQAYGLTPVLTRITTGGIANWVARLRSLCRRACQRLARRTRNQSILALHLPPPD